MSEQVINYQLTEEGIAIVTLNRPAALNAINMEMKIELYRIMNEIAEDSHVKSVIITGEGRAFCAGGDVKEMNPTRNPIETRDRMKKYLLKTVLLITKMEKPVIMAVNGYAVGAGCNLALAGDIILASTKAVFSEIFVNVGLIPDAGGLYFLPRLVGLPKAKELIFRGSQIGAEEAERIGLVNYVVEHESLLDEAMTLAKEFANGPTKAIGVAKTMLNQSLEMDLETALDYEAMAQSVIGLTEDHKEGTRSFTEKRKPNFSGR